MTYRPPHVREDDPEVLVPLIARAPLATLVTVADGEPVVTYVPMLVHEIDGVRVLQGHIARANPQWRGGDGSAVALFRVAEHHISPSWYATKQRDPRVVPTYDYVAIEARGRVRWVHDRDWLHDLVGRLTDDQEARVGSVWSIADAPEAYMESQLQAIVGVELRIESLIGLFKLNRNHPEENIEGVRRGLAEQGSPEAHRLEPFLSAPRGVARKRD